MLISPETKKLIDELNKTLELFVEKGRNLISTSNGKLELSYSVGQTPEYSVCEKLLNYDLIDNYLRYDFFSFLEVPSSRINVILDRDNCELSYTLSYYDNKNYISVTFVTNIWSGDSELIKLLIKKIREFF